MKNENIKRLKFIRNMALAVFLVATTIVSFTEYKFLAVLTLILGIYIEYRFFICPHCKGRLDPRIKLQQEIYCPLCGKQL